MSSALSFVLFLVAMVWLQATHLDIATNEPQVRPEQSKPAEQRHPDLGLEHADVPFYPPVARAAGASGTIDVEVLIRGGLVAEIQARSGPQILIAAVKENIKSWRFHRWVNARISTRFIYQIARGEQVAPNARIELELPRQAVITTIPPLLDSGKADK